MSQTITLGDAILAARETAERAHREYVALLGEAQERGASYRQLAKLLGVSASTVFRLVESSGAGPRRSPNVLEDPR